VAQSRRARLHAATTAEIRQAARRILRTRGPDSLGMRAIAREIGLTPPALYRYFGTYDDLRRDLVTELVAEVTATLRDAASAHTGAAERLVAGSRALRGWALSNPREYALLFAEGCLLGVAATELFIELWPSASRHLILTAWIRLHGHVSLETLGHLEFAPDDPEPMFETLVAELVTLLNAR
jgi:AcrR family transcriptional regulator